MLPADLDLARLCASSESDAAGFDFIDAGAKTGVWFGIKYVDGYDIIVFRGSLLFSGGKLTPDWLRDFNSRMILVDKLGDVHAGFYEQMPEVYQLIQPRLRGLPVVITGHSLGAARAIIYSAISPIRPVRIVIFGCPRPGTQRLADIFLNDDITSYKNRHDPVTDVPVFVPLEFPYVPATSQYARVDGMVDFNLGPPWADHHADNYVKGIENAKLSAIQ